MNQPDPDRNASPQLPPRPAAPRPPALPQALSTQPYSDALMPQTNPWAIVSLCASLLGWCGLFGIGGLVGIIAGVAARNQILTSYGTQTGEGLAIVGIILGAINVLFTCLVASCVLSAFSALLAGF